MMNLELTPLESEAIEWLLRGDEPVLAALREQFSLAKVLSREMTGIGFYVNFVVPPEVRGLQDELPIKRNFYLGDVEARLDCLQREVGFLLWITEGKLDYLEGHTFGEEWPTQIARFEVKYIGGRRDWNALRRQWEVVTPT